MGEWIEWHGGPCPIARGALYDAKLRNGLERNYRIESADLPWSEKWWSHVGGPYDIIAYRLVEPQQRIANESSKFDSLRGLRYTEAEVAEIRERGPQPPLVFNRIPRAIHFDPQQATETKQERQHVSAAAAEALAKSGGASYEGWSRRKGVVIVTVAEHDELLQRSRDRREQDCVVRDCLDYTGDGKVSVPVADIIASPKVQQQVKNVERLRKGVIQDDAESSGSAGGVYAVAGAASAKTRMPMSVADNDHRLGLGLPDGEPCEPMSSYSWRRING